MDESTAPRTEGNSKSAEKKPRPSGDEDLSDELRQTVTREVGDVVRCTRIDGRFYRCNWWRTGSGDVADNASNRGLQLASTYRVGRSAFLEVTRTSQGLRIVESRPGGQRTPLV